MTMRGFISIFPPGSVAKIDAESIGTTNHARFYPSCSEPPCVSNSIHQLFRSRSGRFHRHFRGLPRQKIFVDGRFPIRKRLKTQRLQPPGHHRGIGRALGGQLERSPSGGRTSIGTGSLRTIYAAISCRVH